MENTSNNVSGQPVQQLNVPANQQVVPQQTGDPLLTEKHLPEDLDTLWNNWKCLQCGYVYEGQKPLSVCPRCGNSDPDKFDDPS